MTNRLILLSLFFSLVAEAFAQNPPVLDPIGSKSVNNGSILYFKATATDLDGDDLTYSIIENIPGLDIFKEQGLLSWIPDESQIGTHTITIEVSDGNETDSETIAITVNDASVSGDIIYVDADANGANNGTSWTDAFNDLNSALNQDADGDQIWVAEGTYYTDPAGERTQSFVVNKNVVIYGGFSGTESSVSQRDVVLNPTIVSGDRGQDDDTNGNEENSYHVLWFQTTDRAAGIDGLIIEGGHADGESSHNDGAAIQSFVGNTVLRVNNSIIENNTANANGVSSIVRFGGSSAPGKLIIANSIFRNNTSSGNVFSLSAFDDSTPYTRVDIYYSNITSNDAQVLNAQRKSIVTRFYNSLILDHMDDYLRILNDATNEFYNCAFDNDPPNMFSPGISVFDNNLIDQVIELATDHQFTTRAVIRNVGNDDYVSVLGPNPKDIAGNNRVNEGQSDIGAIEFTNYAPVLNTSFDLSLAPLDEDVTDSDGVSVSSLINDNNIQSDRNYQPLSGIAIVTTSTLNGAWQYSVDQGQNWVGLGTTSMENALLLSSSDLNKIRFIPNP